MIDNDERDKERNIKISNISDEEWKDFVIRCLDKHQTIKGSIRSHVLGECEKKEEKKEDDNHQPELESPFIDV